MAWPDNTPVIDTTNFLNDSGTVTGASGARSELVTLIDRLNQALDSIDAGDTPYTNNNSADLMKTLASGLNNDIGLVNSTGNPIRSGKTISTSVGADDSTVPTGKAVQTYVGNNSGGSIVYFGAVPSTSGSGDLPMYTPTGLYLVGYSWSGSVCTVGHNFFTNTYGVSVTSQSSADVWVSGRTDTSITTTCANPSLFYFQLTRQQ